MRNLWPGTKVFCSILDTSFFPWHQLRTWSLKTTAISLSLIFPLTPKLRKDPVDSLGDVMVASVYSFSGLSWELTMCQAQRVGRNLLKITGLVWDRSTFFWPRFLLLWAALHRSLSWMPSFPGGWWIKLLCACAPWLLGGETDLDFWKCVSPAESILSLSVPKAASLFFWKLGSHHVLPLLVNRNSKSLD